ncbi:MAG: arylesterase [Oligoflexales bacterium]
MLPTSHWRQLLVSCLFVVTLSACPSEVRYILVIGDSLTAGAGIDADDAYPALLETKLRQDLGNFRVINAGANGAMTSAGPELLQSHIAEHTPEMTVVALGANDVLRGVKPEVAKKNLEQIIKMSLDQNMKVVLVGLQTTNGYNSAYHKRFAKIYVDLAAKYSLALVPSLLEGIVGHKDLNLADGKHPNEKGHEIMADHVFEVVAPNL